MMHTYMSEARHFGKTISFLVNCKSTDILFKCFPHRHC